MTMKTKFRKLLFRGLCNLISGMVFGTGCLVAEHVDSYLEHSKEASSTESVTQVSTQK
jgi:hypothetical protein